jgi:outer membrane protein assembly factor BamE (lipoprotein component of BamABCDE complex)
MKTIKAIQLPVLIISVCLCLWGCAWGHYTEGSVFDKSDINQIVKGKTTAADLMNIFGTPYSKTPQADGGEQWNYFCSRNFEAVGGIPVFAVDNTSKQQENLTVLINKDRVVEDYTLSEGPMVKKTQEDLVVTPLYIPVTIGTQTSTNSKPEGTSPKN